ncbi:ABC transporter ATP-binding protein [Polynucleobacter paneuropaeus]|uniref:ABC transporter ATP-binding protein n=1 Tax=Polynucleobacter paneuropaeus TaxID=2527775 RepID=UPI001BFE667A|nr:ABC transporter ATP-binding protein [Polynucleobacter paneuropaeus]
MINSSILSKKENSELINSMASKIDFEVVKKIWRLLDRQERKNALVLLVMMIIGIMLETLGIGILIPAIALFTQDDISLKYPILQPFLQQLGNPSQASIVITGMLVLVGVFLIKSFFLAFLVRQQMQYCFGVQARLSQMLFSIYMRQPYIFHLQRNSSKLIFSVVNEVNTLIGNGLIPLMTLFTEITLVFGLCSLLLFVQPKGILIAGSLMVIFSWIFHRFTAARIRSWGELRQHHDGARIQHLQQGLGGAKDVKIFGRESEFIGEYRLHNVLTAKVQGKEAAMQQIPRLYLELLAIIGFAVVVITMVVQDQPIDTILPVVGLFAAASFRLMPSVSRVLGALHALNYSLPSINSVYAEATLPIPHAIVRQNNTHAFCEQLELVNVCFGYPGGTTSILSDISLRILPGQTIGFIGFSGAGKSTLVDLLLGLLTPTSGEISVDGKNINLNLRSWQDQVGYVPQSIYLIDDSLRRNIAFGLPNELIDDAAVYRAIKLAQLDGFVADLGEGIETRVGERGVRLSGGQRQRIGIARALYHDPTVLVLDEATSALDNETEHGVMEAIKALHGSKTVIIVAHRMSTVENCDYLYRLDKGTLIFVDQAKNGIEE